MTRALPRLLDRLDALGLHATFFVEAINCESNAGAVGEILSRGHELGVHGWSHEPWAELTPERERELLERSVAAFDSIGARATVFRPPGGGLTAATPALLRELGYRRCSPAREAAPAVGTQGIEWIPFDWELVDAYHLMARFGPLRARRGDSAAPLGARDAGERLAAALRRRHPGPQPQVVVLHPFLMLDDDWWDGTRQTLDLIAELSS
ncbi:MAG TPA: polysaccharide deacetylase family protein [Solirubrobacteraceae bacterium]|nr:polysaccharide deacetylase family protein [Solirubrobacteraceae bacterium]